MKENVATQSEEDGAQPSLFDNKYGITQEEIIHGDNLLINKALAIAIAFINTVPVKRGGSEWEAMYALLSFRVSKRRKLVRDARRFVIGDPKAKPPEEWEVEGVKFTRDEWEKFAA